MIALARKYRPRKFADVAVQSHVSNTLKGAIAAKRIAHGYLLSGPRGVGKTTLARVLAMALNCERGAPGGEPCGDCESCKRIWGGSASLDVVEIDAASNRGVDDARELRERAMYAPSGEDRYKVYIVDEAHMLTREAWNALLKILEEPPPRVVFVFATTEPQKIAQSAAPVLSRLQRFDFKRIGPADIRARLENVLQQEQLKAEPEAIGMIARAADGSMRDALSLTDQVLAMGGRSLTAAATRDALGLVPEDEYLAVLDIIAERRAGDVFTLSGRLANAGVDFGQFMAGIGEMLRAQLSISLGSDVPEISDHARTELEARKNRLAPADVLRMLNVMGEMEIRFKRSGQQQLLVETMLVRFALMDRTVELEDVLQALKDGTGGPDDGPKGGSKGPDRAKTASPAPPEPSHSGAPSRSGARASSGESVQAAVAPIVMPTVSHASPPAAEPRRAPDLAALTGRWDDLVARFRTLGKALVVAALEAASPHAITGKGDLTIKLDEPNDFHAKAIDQSRADIAAILGEWFDGITSVAVFRAPSAGAAPSEKPRRVTDEMVKSERLNMLRRKDALLDAAIDVLDLEIAE
ncbi:MAG TPA: DNA polymerase III subunit gamma/tau [Gemmatimonadaceae bacterium]|nr:DNA polymerase III subunit gamma/tau [Gemmatimonadaceae bacterium]